MNELNQQPNPETAGGTPPSAAQEAPRYTAPVPEPPKKVRRVGTFAFGLTLVAAGVLLVAKTFVPGLDLVTIARLSPAVLVVLGVEVLVYAVRPDVKLKFDFLSMFATAVILLVVGGASCVPLLIRYIGPEYDGTVNRLTRKLENDSYAAVSADPGLKNAIHDVSFHVYLERYLQPDGSVNLDEDGVEAHAYYTLNPVYETAEEFAADCQAIMRDCTKAGVQITEYRFDTWNGNAGDEIRPYFFLNARAPWQSESDLATLAGNVTVQWYYRDGIFSSREELESVLNAATAETAQEESTFYIDGLEMTEEEMQAYFSDRLNESYEAGYQDGLAQQEENRG